MLPLWMDQVMQCPRCGEWSVCIYRPGWRGCLNCGWGRPVEWAKPDYHFCDGKGKDAP
jgi:hypothetical protein